MLCCPLPDIYINALCKGRPLVCCWSIVHRGMELDGGGVGLVPFPGHSSDRWGLIIIAIEAYHLSIYLSVSNYLYISTMDISWAWTGVWGARFIATACTDKCTKSICKRTTGQQQPTPFIILPIQPHSDTGEGL